MRSHAPPPRPWRKRESLPGTPSGESDPPVQISSRFAGLRRAFQVAGARTVITSLWSVEDEATRAWMGHLYRERLRGASTAEAVRSASLKMIESLKRSGLPAHPYYWAGFVAVGDWK